MGLADKIKEFFAEDESWKQKPAIRYEGKVFTSWNPEEDKWAVWPNARCAKCPGITLKKEGYWNKETDTWYHPECLESLSQKKKE